MPIVKQIDIRAIFEKASGHKLTNPKSLVATGPVKQNVPRTNQDTTPDLG